MNYRNLAKRWARIWSTTSSRQLHRKFHFTWKKKRPEIYKALKPFLNLELSQYSKSGSMVSSSEPAAARSDCRRLGNALCLCWPVRPAQAVPESGPKSLAVDLPSKPSITFWNSLWRDCQMTCRGLNFDLDLNSAAWPMSCKGFIASETTASVWSLNSF